MRILFKHLNNVILSSKLVVLNEYLIMLILLNYIKKIKLVCKAKIVNKIYILELVLTSYFIISTRYNDIYYVILNYSLKLRTFKRKHWFLLFFQPFLK